MADRCLLPGVILVLVLGLFVRAAPAADVVPTPEQLQQFQQLSPEQRQAVVRAIGEPSTPLPPSPTPPAPVNAAPAVSPGADVDTAAHRLRAGDTVLLGIQKVARAADGSDNGGTDAPPPVIEKKIYVLDQAGALVIPDVGRIILAGLSEPEAKDRLAIEPGLRGRTISLQVLPVEPELKPFGYDLFRNAPSTFAPVTDIPVPADYVVGPEDTVIVQLFGKQNEQYELAVTRDGVLLFPGIGPLSVAGLTFPRLQQEIQARVQHQLSGVQASVTLGRIRSIRVFVLGDAERPGSYAVGGMSTLTNALFASGGVKPIGSLRDIQLKRSGKIVARMDLYDLLLQGNTGADARLLPGDVIFVPPGGKKVGIAGEIRRPAIYELKDESTLEDLIGLAGGLLPEAFPQKVQIERVEKNQQRVLLDVDLTQPSGPATRVQAGDMIRIFPVLDRIDQRVSVSGHVNRPGDFQWFSGMHLTDLLPSLSDLQPQADGRYLLIKRRDPLARTVELIDADLVAALGGKNTDVDPLLQPEDEIHVFDVDEDRSPVIQPWLQFAEIQSAPGRPVYAISIDGMVHHPGQYPLSPGMKVSDLMRAAGGVTDRAYTLAMELTRHSVVDGERRESSRYSVDLAAVLGGDATRDVALAAYDQAVVRRIPNWDETGSIEIQGEVRFPGKYPVVRGEKLSQLIQRAGGLTADAYPRAAVFLRESVREREQESIHQLAVRFEHELALLTEQEDKEAALEGEMLLGQIKSAKATGRMVINLERLLRHEDDYDIVVNAGDKLYIPQRPQEVTVIGEVYNPISHLYNSKLDWDDYVRLSGDVTEGGNKKAIYVIHADGSVSPTGGWFTPRVVMGPGDTVVVPMKIDRLSKLKLVTSVTQVMYQLALTVASLKVVNVF
jgi:protein involved in polysaccharide export with SLBB domain